MGDTQAADSVRVEIVRASDYQLIHNLDKITTRLSHGDLSDEVSLSCFVIEHSARRTLPYGIWTCESGRQVVFNREYQPILQCENGVYSYANQSEWVKDMVKTEYLYHDGNNPMDYISNKYQGHKLNANQKKEAKKSLLICLDILKKFTPKEGLSVNRRCSIERL